jgi:hypothetical protein
VNDDYFEMPEAIKSRVKGLDHKVRWKIVESIMNFGEMQYTEILSKMGMTVMEKGDLNYHLKILQETGVIDRFEKFDGDNRSYYAIDILTKSMINGLLSALDYSQEESIFMFIDDSEKGKWNKDISSDTTNRIILSIDHAVVTPTEPNQSRPMILSRVTNSQ